VGRDRVNTAAGFIRTLYEVGAVGRLDDGSLLERFAMDGEASDVAFAALVRRHGSMVLSTCRGILRDEHAAQDATQATFLVLARKADSLVAVRSLGAWLHQVAIRVASCERSARARRASHERRASRRESSYRLTEETSELRAVIHEELGRLPERYRAAIVLCHLEGLTHEQAAERLGWPVGTVRSRLSRGRDRLRGRLAERGLAPELALLAPTSIPGQVAIPAWLATSTARAAVRLVAGRTVAGAISPSVSSLTKGALEAMILTKLKSVAVVVMSLGIVASGASMWVHSGASAQAPPPAPPSGAPIGALPGGPGQVPQAASIPERLDAVEKQLARLLQLLEGGGSGRTPSFTPQGDTIGAAMPPIEHQPMGPGVGMPPPTGTGRMPTAFPGPGAGLPPPIAANLPPGAGSTIEPPVRTYADLNVTVSEDVAPPGASGPGLPPPGSGPPPGLPPTGSSRLPGIGADAAPDAGPTPELPPIGRSGGVPPGIGADAAPNERSAREAPPTADEILRTVRFKQKVAIWDQLVGDGFIGRYDSEEITPEELILRIYRRYAHGRPSDEDLAKLLQLFGPGSDQVTLAPEMIVRRLFTVDEFVDTLWQGLPQSKVGWPVLPTAR
jgi:RNA polymerase sigma factor (sigma-70 family)